MTMTGMSNGVYVSNLFFQAYRAAAHSTGNVLSCSGSRRYHFFHDSSEELFLNHRFVVLSQPPESRYPARDSFQNTGRTSGATKMTRLTSCPPDACRYSTIAAHPV